MKYSRIFFGIACMASVLLLLISCQQGENGLDQAQELNGEFYYMNENAKVAICHNDHIINVSINAVPAHRGHGDAIDMDGDGYFDSDNSCSPSDCDDTDADSTPGPDGNCDMGSIEGLLPGTWETTDIVLEMKVGELSALDYLTDVLGMSPTDAADRIALLEAELIPELEVTLVLNADHTYESFFAWGMDSGTWSLSPDESTLTLLEGSDTIIVNMLTVTDTTLMGTLSDSIPYDLDGDAGTPDEDVSVVATVTMTRV